MYLATLTAYLVVPGLPLLFLALIGGGQGLVTYFVIPGLLFIVGLCLTTTLFAVLVDYGFPERTKSRRGLAYLAWFPTGQLLFVMAAPVVFLLAVRGP